MLDLNLLRYLLAIRESGSLDRAAKRLSVSLSTATMAMTNLKHVFSDPLFTRVGGELVATAFCEQLCEHVSSVLRRLDDGLAQIEQEHSRSVWPPLNRRCERSRVREDIAVYGGLNTMPQESGAFA